MRAGAIVHATGGGLAQCRPSVAKTWLKAIEQTSRIEAEPYRLFADVVEEWAQPQPRRPALLFDAINLTSASERQYGRFSNQFYSASEGFARYQFGFRVVF